MKHISRLSLTFTFSVAVMLVQLSTPAWARFIKVEPIDGIWWMLDPANRAFVSRGVDTVTFNQDYIRDTKESPYAKSNMELYHSQDAWRQATAKRLQALNFNTLGAWSDTKIAQENTNKKKPLYYTVILNIADSFDSWNHVGLCDFFDPKFARSAKETAEKICTPLKDDEKLIGYFGDNELLWVDDARPVLLKYLNFNADAPGREAAISYLQRHYASFEEFNRIWNTDYSSWQQFHESAKISGNPSDKDARVRFEKDCDSFAGFVATRYFDIVDLAMKVADPNHMNLGCRFSTYPGGQILRACASHVDVISFNCYEPDPTKTIRRYASAGKPLLIGEFSFRSKDSGLPNKKGAGPIVATQQDRAGWFTEYVKHALASPNVVGYHWFEHVDQPKEGRFDGEDSNYGIANIEDVPYADLNRAMKDINLQTQTLHLQAVEQ